MQYESLNLVLICGVNPTNACSPNVSLVFNNEIYKGHVCAYMLIWSIINSVTLENLRKSDSHITHMMKDRSFLFGINKPKRRGKRAGGKVERPKQTVLGNRPNDGCSFPLHQKLGMATWSRCKMNTLTMIASTSSLERDLLWKEAMSLFMPKTQSMLENSLTSMFKEILSSWSCRSDSSPSS